MKRQLAPDLWARLEQLAADVPNETELRQVIADIRRECTSGDAVFVAFQAGRRIGHREGFRTGKAAGESETILGIIDHFIKQQMRATPDASEAEVPPEQIKERLERLLEERVKQEVKSLESRLADGDTLAS